jgi:two-component system sensor histidine kinase VicK
MTLYAETVSYACRTLEKSKWIDPGHTERTEVLYNFEDILACTLDILPKINKTHDLCLDSWGPSAVLGTEVVKNGYIAVHKRGARIRLITEIIGPNIVQCEEFMKFAEVRHLDKVRGNFSVSDTKWYTASAVTEKDKSPPRLIFSNVREIAEQHQYFFKTLWNKAIPAEQRIREIEEGIERTNLEFIPNPRESIKRAWDLIKSAKQEVMVMLSSPNTFRRQFAVGGLEAIQQAVRNGARVKLLIPSDRDIARTLSQVRSVLPQAEFRAMDASLTTSITIVLVDQKECMFFELKDDSATDSNQAVGLSLYSASKSIVSSYTSILEAIWKQSELNEHIRQANEKLEAAYNRLEEHERIQKEFINVAAHELRTPVQPLLGVTEIIEQTLNGKERTEITKEELEMLIRNAKRLARLSSDILEASRIESQSLNLNKEVVNLNEKIKDAIKDVKSYIPNDRHVEIIFDSKGIAPTTMVEADESRLFGVLSNILKNAIKFTDEGTIHVTLEERDGQAIVSVKDTGRGIDPEIFPKLFTKFATKSEQGTGLGLYLSKGIIEAHGGRIWAGNNEDQKGATVTFTLPLVQ